jgi:tRNA threonylcarbamoyl adenosine modification protein (Sua5/YciO/YrdC/YwlC family)
LHSQNPEKRKIKHIVEILKKGGVIIYPTDTLYGLGCDITNHKAVEKIARIKGVDPKKADFSFIIRDLSHINDYAKPFDNRIFKLLKKNLPGPFTFILKANNSVPKMLKNNKKTVGIRIPDCQIVQELVEELGLPILSTSIVKVGDDFNTYPSDPYDIYHDYKHLVDIVIDSEVDSLEVSTVVDCSGDEIEIIRQGKGELEN